MLERCLAEINRQLDAQGLILRRGTILDASVVRATPNPPRGNGIAPGDPHPQEPGADWTRKDGKPVFGYRFHIGIDEGSGLIRTTAFTSARVQDVEHADALITGDERCVHADRGYEGRERRVRLKAAGIKDRILHRRHRYMPVLPHWQARRNRLIARRRAPVEAVFSAMKRLYGKARTRCLFPRTQRRRRPRLRHHLQSQARRHPHQRLIPCHTTGLARRRTRRCRPQHPRSYVKHPHSAISQRNPCQGGESCRDRNRGDPFQP